MKDLKNLLGDLVTEHFQAASNVFAKHAESGGTGPVSPALAVAYLNTDGNVAVDIIVFEEFGENHNEMLELTGRALGNQGKKVLAVALALESWIGDSSDYMSGKFRRVSDMPNRKEMLLCQGMAIDPTLQVLVSSEIIRDSLTNYPTLAEPIRTEYFTSKQLVHLWNGFKDGWEAHLKGREASLASDGMEIALVPAEEDSPIHPGESEEDTLERLTIEYAYNRAFGNYDELFALMNAIQKIEQGWERSHELLVEKGWAKWFKDTGEYSEDLGAMAMTSQEEAIARLNAIGDAYEDVSIGDYGITFYPQIVRDAFADEEEDDDDTTGT